MQKAERASVHRLLEREFDRQAWEGRYSSLGSYFDPSFTFVRLIMRGGSGWRASTCQIRCTRV